MPEAAPVIKTTRPSSVLFVVAICAFKLGRSCQSNRLGDHEIHNGQGKHSGDGARNFPDARQAPIVFRDLRILLEQSALLELNRHQNKQPNQTRKSQQPIRPLNPRMTVASTWFVAFGMQIVMQKLNCDDLVTLKLDSGPKMKNSPECLLEGKGARNRPFIPPLIFRSFRTHFHDERSKTNEQKY